MVEECLNL